MSKLQQFYKLIALSLNGNNNNVSTSRLQSYIILLPILLMIVVFLVIEIWSFSHAIKLGIAYHLSNEILIVYFGMLSHHLAILFSRNKAQSIAELSGLSKPVEDNVVQNNVVEDTQNKKEDNYTDQV